ncbi:MAG: Peptidase M16 protein [Candidatus Peregrinibacteria bacterium Greene0416_19]|nr:MAG: Peptidase M16 protein [Candidatus Peregrinibacteria bacterium Greene0416_19]
MFTVQKLKSGLRVLTAPIDGTESVTVLIFAGAGSRYEERKERGISHFLEHMFFKGGKKYRNTKEVSAAIDGVGGEFNAFTGKEYAGYYVKIAATETELACDVLSDMLLHASFPPQEIEKERGVIMEEERMYQDTPMYRAGWDFEELIFGDHPLGWDTIGTEELIRGVTQADFQKHKDEFYTPDNLVVTFAGRIDETRALALSEQYFSVIKGKNTRRFPPFEGFAKEKVFLRTKSTEQAHLVLGVPGVHSLHADHFVQKVLSVILGGNMSSRMFLNIREAQGLCYYIATDVDNYLDAGALSTRAGVDQSRLHEAVRRIREEYLLCARDSVTDEEVDRAKAFLKGKITLSLEDSEERAHFYGKQELLYPKTRDTDEYFMEIDKVSVEQVHALAKRLLLPEEMRLVVIGKEERKDALEQLMT